MARLLHERKRTNGRRGGESRGREFADPVAIGSALGEEGGEGSVIGRG